MSSPPWGLGPQSLTITRNNLTIQVRDSGTYTLVLESALHLTSEGVAAFVLPNGFFFQKAKNGVRYALEKCGLYLNAVIALPAGTFSPYTAIPTNIVIISRTKTADLFVGQLTPGTDSSPLLENLTKRKTGGSMELGRLELQVGTSSRPGTSWWRQRKNSGLQNAVASSHSA